MANIALVDDDKNILASVSMLLEQEGYHVRTFSDGAAALTALTTTPPDLAILDIKNAAHGRAGVAAPPAPGSRPAGDLSHQQG